MGLKKHIVLVGMMGAGKSRVGRELSRHLNVTCKDVDIEIEAAAGFTVSEIFERFGEESFREGEKKVVLRLLAEPPMIISTGGGSFINDDIRSAIKEHGLSIWLRPDLELIVARTGRTDHRPMLKNGNPREVLQKMMSDREGIYAKADFTVSIDQSSTPAQTARKIIDYATAQGVI